MKYQTMARCISPVWIRADKGSFFAPCGSCIECLKTKQGDWSFRIKQELKMAKTAYFVTLTYDEICIPKNGMLDVRDLQLYIKRLRSKNKKLKLKYYAVGEYGGETDRAHYHAILFDVEKVEEIEKCWQMGFVQVGNVTSDSIGYVTKYVIQKHKCKFEIKPFAIMSKRLGYQYIKDNYDYHKSGLKTYVMDNGYKKHMPRYYADKVFNYKEKERIQNENVKRIDEKEESEMKKFKDSRSYFEDKLENREQMVKRVIKQSKKNKI